MQCTISNNYDGGESYELRITHPRARKEHLCGECHRMIKKGEKYELYYGVMDGSIFCEKTCSDCVTLRNVFFPNGFVFGRTMDEIKEKVIYDLHGEVSSDCILPLSNKAKEYVFGLVERAWELSNRTSLIDGK